MLTDREHQGGTHEEIVGAKLAHNNDGSDAASMARADLIKEATVSMMLPNLCAAFVPLPCISACIHCVSCDMSFCVLPNRLHSNNIRNTVLCTLRRTAVAGVQPSSISSCLNRCAVEPYTAGDVPG